MKYRVWHAGGCALVDGCSVEAHSVKGAAVLGAAELYEASDPIERFDVFVQEGRAEAVRFTILCDIARISFADQSMTVRAVEFTPVRITKPPRLFNGRKRQGEANGKDDAR